MFWFKKPLKQWIQNQINGSYFYSHRSHAEWKKGFLVGQVLPDRQLSEAELFAICERYNRSDKYVQFLLKKSRFGRYLVIFPESPFLHVYFDEHLGVLLDVS